MTQEREEKLYRQAILEAMEPTTNIEGAALAIGMSVSWVQKHLKEIPHWRVGKSIVFDKNTCREWSRQYNHH